MDQVKVATFSTYSKENKKNPKYIIASIFLLVVVLIVAFVLFFLTNNVKLSNRPIGDVGAVNGIVKESVLTPDEQKVVIDRFEESWEGANTEFGKFNAYYEIHSYMTARYNSTRDTSFIEQLDSVEAFMAENWPDYYKDIKDSGGFFRTENEL